MALKHRIRRLERARRDRICPACSSEPRLSVEFCDEDERDELPDPEPCPVCGEVRVTRILFLRFGNEAVQERMAQRRAQAEPDHTA